MTCVAIDLDGTLIDSVPDLANAANIMLAEMSKEPCAEKQIRQWVGNGIPRLVERVLSNDFNGVPDKSEFERGLPIFYQAYQDNVCKLSRCYPGVEAGLDELKKASLKVACVTNKAAAFTLPLLKQVGISDYFELIVSGDSLAEKKPHPAPLLHIAEELRQNPAQCILIGDSSSDIKAAQAAGFQSIIVTYGYNQGLNLAALGPDHMVDTFMEAIDIILQQIASP